MHMERLILIMLFFNSFPATTPPGSPLSMAAIIGPIAASVLVIFTIVVIVSDVMLIRHSHSKETAGELYETPVDAGMEENEMYKTNKNNQTQHIVTTANEAYDCLQNDYMPTAANIPTVQNKAYGVSETAVNSDTEEQVNVDEIYVFMNNSTS